MVFGKLKFWKREEELPPTSLEEFLPKIQPFPELNRETLDKAPLSQDAVHAPEQAVPSFESPVLQPSVPSFIQQMQQPVQPIQQFQLPQQPVQIPQQVEKELQLISAKLDTLKAMLESISDKLDYGRKEVRWR